MGEGPHCSEVILVEGLFDYAALRQAGFSNVTCSLGTHLNADQFRQLCDGPRTVYLAFDDDQPTRAASRLQSSWPIDLPRTVSRLVAFCCLKDTIPTPSSLGAEMHDQFQSLLEAAQP